MSERCGYIEFQGKDFLDRQLLHEGHNYLTVMHDIAYIRNKQSPSNNGEFYVNAGRVWVINYNIKISVNNPSNSLTRG